MSENVGASTSRNTKGLHGLYRENFTFLLEFIDSGLKSCMAIGARAYRCGVLSICLHHH
jgi:hypothetical protein